ncbi:MAG: glycosyltransferase involved in cell wall biosynthesis [Urechidicola sp.]|jgi:glycosyltransferase involved in cell wall biosynthesis
MGAFLFIFVLMKSHFSIIIPVFNRPSEIDELMHSLSVQSFKNDFDVVIVEDGSTDTCESVIEKYQDTLSINYFFKENSGAGLSRNYGMERASGTYFIILDSDVILPSHYLEEVENALLHNFTDAYGGADAAHASFTAMQKAINYSMTSVLTTGGIRGKKHSIEKFQPRSFNMGISKEAFSKTNGYSEMKYGEDIDLTFRLWEKGYKTQFIEKAYVYHKRRSTLSEFFNQTFNFGTARPILNRKYPSTSKLTYWFPSLFIIGLDISIILAIFGYTLFIKVYFIYFMILLIDSFFRNGLKVAFLSIITSFTQFLGYGLGFLKSLFSSI